jgi:hypothetical protein
VGQWFESTRDHHFLPVAIFRVRAVSVNYRIRVFIVSILIVCSSATTFADDIPDLSISFHGVTTSPSPDDIPYQTTDNHETIFVSKTPIISGESIDSIKYIDEFIKVKLTKEGDKLFYDFTKANLGKRMVVMINGKIATAPIIRSPIIGGGTLLPANILSKVE